MRWILSTVIFLLVMLEGTFFQLLSLPQLGTSIELIPRLTLAVILYISLYAGRHEGLLFGLFTGFLTDFVYGGTLGIFTLTFGLIGYLIGLFHRYFHHNIFLLGTAAIIVYLTHEHLLLLIVEILRFSPMEYGAYLRNVMLPSALFNSLFVMAVFIPMDRLMKQFLDDTERKERQRQS
ncbi:rod shape-determining protein MreD [Rubeoparvulum massiliense]|uniref:rod shape-determining protein MreD n=1 Tax=Rubeoparvulum massiliense TaxID=1631346 RepID=UPI00065E2811|nr:rod shape-determining protein MreD [Rubeoparvulum massiliense]